MLERLRKLEAGVRRTRDSFFGQVAGLFNRKQLDEELWEELEELLIISDVGVATTARLLERVRDRVRQEGISEPLAAKGVLKEELISCVKVPHALSPLAWAKAGPTVILVIGVNGTGKTTSIAKLAHYWQRRGHRVILAAADTFRAAAIDQLRIWGERAKATVISHQPGADPGAVVYDAWQAATARGADVLIVDTAGRLHTKFNLMEELRKVVRVLAKLDSTAPHETLLVLDATTGQNAIAQARQFTAAVGVSGIFLAKLDGTAKGGVVFAIAGELGIPIKFLGMGEGLESMAEFDAESFVRALLR